MKHVLLKNYSLRETDPIELRKQHSTTYPQKRRGRDVLGRRQLPVSSPL